MSEVSLNGITKYYGGYLALPEMNLTIEKGQFVTLLGPSGCGKTTTLRIIAGLETPSSGDLHLSGRCVFSDTTHKNIPPEKRGLGFIFQSYALWPNMTVERNITLALRQAKMPKPEIAERLKQALHKVQLEGLHDRYPSELSGGQQQRVAVARLIAARNGILLMDEPLSNLDAVLRTEMRAELKRLSRELKATTVYVTHDQVEALTMSDLIVVMNNGRIQQAGTPYEIYHHPANLFVAEFIGDPKVNLFDATATWRDGMLRISGEGVDFQAADCEYTGGAVRVAVRPEHLRIQTSPREGGIEARIDVVQPTGSQTIVSLDLAGQRVTALVAQFRESWRQDRVWLDFDPAHAMVFDASSQENIRRPMDAQNSIAAE
ncbi:ABC transporter ATP-binding protein [Rhodobacteraceae bacterium]|nr:ABC transporter ATP-binding protein [Paracoccaceae bacterium]